MSGIKKAVLYSLKPHELGFCGSDKDAKNQILRKFLNGKASIGEVKKALKNFKAAYLYYKLIARSNGIKNPFSEKVVAAYWVGNNLLEKVSPKDLWKMVANDFFSPMVMGNKEAKRKILGFSRNSKPHHSFHVFSIGSISGLVDLEDVKMKDACRVCWGKVEDFYSNKLTVSYRPIVFSGNDLAFGDFCRRIIYWNKETIPKIKKGDWISFHWGTAVETLSDEDVINLEKYTQNSMLVK